jgi:hypothetical protein
MNTKQQTVRSHYTEQDNLSRLDEIIRKLDAGEYPCVATKDRERSLLLTSNNEKRGCGGESIVDSRTLTAALIFPQIRVKGFARSSLNKLRSRCSLALDTLWGCIRSS